MANYSVFNYRVWCTTENAPVTTWGTAPPTKCPNDTAHTIDAGTVTIIDEVSQAIVAIREEGIPTGGHFQAFTRTFTCPPGQSTHDTTWTHDRTVMSVVLQTDASHIGDIVALHVAPGTTLGVLTATVGAANATTVTIGATSVQQTEIFVSPTVVQNTFIGAMLQLNDMTNLSPLYEVVSLRDSSVIVAGVLARDWPSSTMTLIQQTVIMLNDLEIGPPTKYEIGRSKIGGSYVPAGRLVRVVYTNQSSTDTKKIVPYIESLY